MPQGALQLRFEVLGRLRAWRGDQELDLGPGKQQAVLAVLLLHQDRPVQTASIVDAVWGEDPPDNGTNVVQKYVAGLRRVLEPDRSPRSPARVLELTGAGYVLHVPPDGLDAEVFRKRVRAALAERPAVGGPETAMRLGEALSLWRDTPLAGLTGPVFDAARERMVEERAAALEACAEIELELGRHARLVPELIRLVGDFPLREGPRHLLMLALYRCGRQAEALAAYRDARGFLAEEFGVEPGERLQDLHLRILRSDPSLLSWTPADRKAPAAPTPSAGPAPVPWRLPDAGPASAAEPASVAVHAPMAWPAYPNAAYSGPVHPVTTHPVTVPGAAHPGAARFDGAFRQELAAERHASLALRITAIAVPIFTCGTLSWAMVAYFAGRRRSPWLALASLGWLALTLFSWIAVSDSAELQPIDDWSMAAGMVAALGGAVHVALLTSAPWPSRADDRGTAMPDPRAVELIRRRTLREQARGLLLHHPGIAHELRIGRPDLARAFDDGGLVDVNAVPEHVLALLPGLGPREARLIVTVRDAQGPFESVDDLIGRGVVPADAIPALYEVLIAVPLPVDAPEEPIAP